MRADSQRHSDTREQETRSQRRRRQAEDAQRQAATRAEERRRLKNKIYKLAFDNVPGQIVTFGDIGKKDIVCRHCQAIKWKKEAPGMCCKNGRVSLPPLRTLPDCLTELLDGVTEDSRHFLENIRRYNNAFSMTSFGHTAVTQRGWNPSFIIQGQVHHS